MDNSNIVVPPVNLDFLKSMNISTPPSGPSLMDTSDDATRVFGCLNDGDKIYHRSKANNWNEATYGKLPYERLEDVTLENILKRTHLDWEVKRVPMYSEVGDQKILVPNHFATMRTDTNEVLGVVGNRYEILQNSQLIDVITPFMEIEDLCVESGGAFTDGKGNRPGYRVYVQFKLPDFITVKGDQTEQSLFISNAHDGSSNVVVGFTTIRTVCRNTFAMNLKNATLRVRHSAAMKSRIEDAHKTLEIANQFSKQLNSIFNKLAERPVSNQEVRNLLTMVVMDDRNKALEIIEGKEEPSTRLVNVVDDMQTWVEKEFKSSKALDGNLYGWFNGVTAYYNHGVKFRGNDRFSNIVNGSPAKKMDRAFSMAKHIVGV